MVISVSAAVPAPQQLDKVSKGRVHTIMFPPRSIQLHFNRKVQAQLFLNVLDVGGNVVDLGTVLICHNHALCGSGVRSKNHPILKREQNGDWFKEMVWPKIIGP